MGKNRDKEVWQAGGNPNKFTEKEQIERSFERKLKSGRLPASMEQVLAALEKQQNNKKD